jgi:hypothetical protein
VQLRSAPETPLLGEVGNLRTRHRLIADRNGSEATAAGAPPLLFNTLGRSRAEQAGSRIRPGPMRQETEPSPASNNSGENDEQEPCVEA